MIYRVKFLSLLGDKKQDCFYVETCGNTSDGKLSGHLVPLPAAEIDVPLRAQSKVPVVYSSIRECVCDCKCNSIHFHQTCHMNSLCNQRSGCLPLVSKSCFCCSETQSTCLTSCH